MKKRGTYQGDLYGDRVDKTIDRMEPKHFGGEFSLSDKDMAELGGAVRKVYEFMKDGEWRSPEEIIEASGVRSGERRMRQLRDVKGLDVQVKRIGGTRRWVYRLVRIGA